VQILELIQHMWKVAAEPAVRGQLLTCVAGVSLAPPAADGLSVPASTIQWDRGLVEQHWGENASKGFGVTEEDLHRFWLSHKKGDCAQFTMEHILNWLRENSSKMSGDTAVDASGAPAAPGAGGNSGGVWC
jgi:hypothetical protein